MVTSSQSAPGQFAAAVRRADPRSKAGVSPVAPVTGIQHGHEGEAVEGDFHGPLSELPAKWAAESIKTGLPSEMMPGMPRNADGSKRED